jgi:hypothetical protein
MLNFISLQISHIGNTRSIARRGGLWGAGTAPPPKSVSLPDLKKFIAITIPIKNRSQINQTLIENFSADFD